MQYYSWIWHHRIGITECVEKETGRVVFHGSNMLEVSKAAELLDEFRIANPDSVLFEES